MWDMVDGVKGLSAFFTCGVIGEKCKGIVVVVVMVRVIYRGVRAGPGGD